MNFQLRTSLVSGRKINGNLFADSMADAVEAVEKQAASSTETVAKITITLVTAEKALKISEPRARKPKDATATKPAGSTARKPGK